MGVLAYVQDHGIMPPHANFGQSAGFPQAMAAEYFEMSRIGGGNKTSSNILRCPADKRPFGTPGAGGGAAKGPTYMAATWGTNATDGVYVTVWHSCIAAVVFDRNDPRYGNLSRIKAGTGFFWDGHTARQVFFSVANPTQPSGHNRHRSGINMVYADGHVAFIDLSPLKPGEYWSRTSTAADDYMNGPVHYVGSGFGVALLIDNKNSPW